MTMYEEGKVQLAGVFLLCLKLFSVLQLHRIKFKFVKLTKIAIHYLTPSYNSCPLPLPIMLVSYHSLIPTLSSKYRKLLYMCLILMDKGKNHRGDIWVLTDMWSKLRKGGWNGMKMRRKVPYKRGSGAKSWDVRSTSRDSAWLLSECDGWWEAEKDYVELGVPQILFKWVSVFLPKDNKPTENYVIFFFGLCSKPNIWLPTKYFLLKINCQFWVGKQIIWRFHNF